MTRWYVVHTKPRAEEKAVSHLQNQAFNCFMPRSHARKASPVWAPLFPHYLFVRSELEIARWRAINGTRAVVGLLTNGKLPLLLPTGVVEALLTKSDQQCIVPLTAMGVFVKGLKARIRGSAFAAQTARINEIFAEERDRVRVLLTLLGAEAQMAAAFLGDRGRLSWAL